MLKQITASLRTSKIATLPSLRQRGQAMVEFAILLILLVMVVMGGAELGITAYHASKTGDGAKAAANEWANAVSFTNGVLVGNALDTSAFSHLDFTSTLVADCSNLDVIPETSPIIIKSSTASNECDLSNSTHLNALVTKLSENSNNPTVDFAIVCTDASNNFVSCNGSDNKYLVEKPILYDQNLVGPRYLLGDHSNPSTFTKANCNGVGYDNGLPNNENIYLFNPLPLDITNCDGSTGKKVSELWETMPKLNQALRSQYHQVCVTDNGNPGEIEIKPLKDCVAKGYQLWLKPPGKMCGKASGREYCPTEGDLNGATGFYFFGDSNISGNNLQYIPTSFANPEFRPTFQLVCGDADYRDSDFDALNSTPAPGCSSLTGAFSVQVNTRYRSIFESFLTFGLQELSDTSLLDYFYNPNKVGVEGSNQLVGTAGSEIGPVGGDNLNPTVKRFRDFRGCYQVDIIPPDNIGEQTKTAVSSCN